MYTTIVYEMYLFLHYLSMYMKEYMLLCILVCLIVCRSSFSSVLLILSLIVVHYARDCSCMYYNL